MNPQEDKADNPYVSPRGTEKLPVTSSPIQPALKALLINAAAIGFFVVVFLVVHNLSEDTRESILIVTFLAIIPVVIAILCLPRPLHYSGLYLSLYAVVQGVCYGVERGPHSMVGGAVGGFGLIAFALATIIILIRGFFYRRRKRAMVQSTNLQSHPVAQPSGSD